MAEPPDQNTTTKIQRGTSLDPDIDAIISRWATTDERSISQTIERLLKSHPEVKAELETATVGARA